MNRRIVPTLIVLEGTFIKEGQLQLSTFLERRESDIFKEPVELTQAVHELDVKNGQDLVYRGRLLPRGLCRELLRGVFRVAEVKLASIPAEP